MKRSMAPCGIRSFIRSSVWSATQSLIVIRDSSGAPEKSIGLTPDP